MHKHLILSAYKKARKERRKIGNNQPSKNILAEDIAAEIDYVIGVKSLKIYYNEARDKETTNEDISINQLIVVNRLCRYLDYRDYEDFVANYKNEKNDDDKPPIVIISHSEETIKENEKSEDNGEYIKNNTSRNYQRSFFIKLGKKIIERRITIIINIAVLLTIVIFISNSILTKNNERWMTWQEDHYTEVKFDITKYFNNELEPFDKNKLSLFKKIKSPDCNTKYFNEKGKPILWYWKKGKGDLEIFESPGIHPINGKTLRPITRYMIREHICKDY